MLGLVGGLLLSFDGMQFVLSRIALLDIFVAFFMLLAVHCHVADRDWYRARLARLTADSGGTVASGTGPVRALVFRPWLVAAGVELGPGLRQQVGGDLPARGVRAARRSSGARGPDARTASARRSPGRCWPTAYPPS